MISGFSKASDKILPRLIASVSGMEKNGKTSFALSAPGPIIYFNFDFGLEGVINKYAGSKDIYVKEYRFSRVMTPDKYVTLMAGFTTDFHSALRSKARTIVIDTATELWELLRLARFGKLTQVQKWHYGPVNAEYITLMREGYSYDKNVVLLHKMKRTYVNDAFTGAYERKGFNDTGYLAQANLEVYRDGLDGGFYLTINDCRQNSALGGMEFPLTDGFSGFGFLAQLIFPDSIESDWE